ncbi:MAG: alpha/beta hydrolase [Fusobacteriales bacterium]|jgi:predicted alpha/beta-fold hydrolase|nr:alpha/beta hydrolase [Fusobacteriales bacterium]
MKLKKLILTVMVFMFSVISFSAENDDVYEAAKNYPYKNSPLMATVFGTPSKDWYKFNKAKLPKKDHVKATRENMPEILRKWTNYDYNIWIQKEEAPLMIIISGTGSTYDSSLSMYLGMMFNDNGYNVITVSSTSTLPFIVSQGRNNYSGYLKDDVKDVYNILQGIISKYSGTMKVSDIYVTGYSLGGFQSLLLHEYDSEQKKIGIKKSLLLNSPVDIFKASRILDGYLVKNGIYDAEGIEKYFDSIFQKMLRNKNIKLANFDMNNLPELMKGLDLSDRDLGILTGLLFRVYSANLTFTGDVFNGGGRLIKSGKVPARFDSITNYFLDGLSISYDEYASEILYPYLVKNEKFSGSYDDFLMTFSMKNSEEFIRTHNEDIIFVTSLDDILIDQTDIAYIRRTFKNRVFFPYGGHTGILWHEEINKILLEKLKEE